MEEIGCEAVVKIAITGASGFIGRQLVPKLVEDGHELLLVGRDSQLLERQFKNTAYASYDELVGQAVDYDLLIHLAVLNNNASKGLEDFRQVNVQFFESVLDMAASARIGRVLNVSSFHALNEADQSAYAISKREALEIARKADGVEVVNLFLPAVHGDHYAGKLAVLNKLPGGLAKGAFAGISSLAPTVAVDRIASFISNKVMSVSPTEDIFLVDPKSENVTYRVLRKAGDLTFALVVILAFWWVLVLAWIWIRVTSRGPGIFKQTRVGQNENPFICYKFRTMKLDTEQVGTHNVAADAITTAGKFLRRTKIDELPQVWNILRGELSLVGPRPCLPVQEVLVTARKNRGVLEVLPGITGFAQINGVDMSDPEKLAKWDERYVNQRSLLLDLRVCSRTLISCQSSHH